MTKPLLQSPGSAQPRPFGAVDAAAVPAPARLEQALAAWRDILGPEHVKADDPTRDQYARTTGVQGHRPLAVLYPDTTAQVQAVLRMASQSRIGVHPISRGKNWGYGDACAHRDHQVILDLRRMNRILEVNTQLGYAVIEPGVTQGQLHQYLADNNTNLWMDASGAGLDASVVGNVLERGFGHTRYGDHFLTSCGLQVVLADGRLLNTGLGHYDHARAHRTYRYGIGPFLDGLFSQSSYGVVTRMGIWLMPRPEDFCAYFLFSNSDDALPDLVDRLAALRMQGVLTSTIHIGNDLRAISARSRYPWDRAEGKTPLPAPLRAKLREEFGVGAWNVAGAIYGTTETVAATRKALRRALAGYDITFLDDRTLSAAERLQGLLNRVGLGQSLGERLEVVKPVYGLLKGIPSDEHLRGAGWRVRGPAPVDPTDPLDCHAGLLWIAPVLPASGASSVEVMRLLDPIFEKHGFEPLVTFTLITERALVCVSNLSFDRREPDDAARAKACYDELTARLAAEGYISYRTGPEGMAKLADHSDVFWDVTAQLKDALDPQNVISIGRYNPHRTKRPA
jgi:4-cresol dehydrogenase (hydroxylating)